MNAPRITMSVAALFGACGVGLIAAGSHQASPLATTAGQMFLFHAPVLMAATLARQAGNIPPMSGLAAIVILMLGVLAFSGDLSVRTFFGWPRLFPMAAPAGGSLMIVGWVVLAIAFMIGNDNDKRP